MESRWSDREAAEFVARLAPRWGEDLALRVYTSRLIGRDPDLVLHGGGNTSLKGTVTTLVGERVEAAAMVREAFGPHWAIVPYVMPGFALAKLAAEVYERDPSAEGLVLMNHGLFTFADDARTAYERMIAGVDRAERFVHARARTRPPPGRGARPEVAPAEAAARLGPVLRGALAEATGDADRPWRRMILEHRASEETLDILAGPDAARIADANPLTPDHVIRTKGPALLLPGDLPLDDAKALRECLDAVVATYRAAYDA